MQHPPEVSPDLAHVELSKRLDSIERRLDRMETNQPTYNADCLRHPDLDALAGIINHPSPPCGAKIAERIKSGWTAW